jgi:[glutamine synthetase] adenylyltransferase / [glutamine synthetase]-adenylyl-L-tyrosine phosphorylase
MLPVNGTWDPSLSEKVLGELIRVDPDAVDTVLQFPDGGVTLLNLLGFSPASLEKIIRNPPLLRWLAGVDVQHSRETHRGTRKLADARWETGGDLRPLRQWKAGELLRVAYREIAGLASCVETTRDITQIAEVCVEQVYLTLGHTLSERWGKPQTGFGILAMGKFGGMELNYSSDIDLIFFYGEDGNLGPRFSHHEFFTRLVEQVVAVFSAATDPLFRIDLRLRPEGATGPLVRSFASIENYYAGYGETWERIALTKARGICGDNELLYEFFQRLQPFIFPRLVSSDLLDEIAEIKIRIERDLVGQENLRRNVKLGIGGIREIEFITQTLQLLHGARNAFLQERNTLKALKALEQLEILPRNEVEALADAYVFLRTVEHRLQIVAEQQTHTLPASEEARWMIARSLRFSSVTEFESHLRQYTDRVREVFIRLFQRENRDVLSERSLEFFGSPDLAEKGLVTLRNGPSNVHVAPRTRRLFAKLEPELLQWLRRMVDPDATLNRFIRFVDAYGIRGLLFETLLANPRFLELLVRLFDASEVFSDIVIRRPQLIEEITRSSALGKNFNTYHFLEGLRSNDEGLDPLEWVRVYRRSEMVRMVLRDILGFATPEELQLEMSQLAEACLCFCAQQIPGGSELTIIALGKFGGYELLYGADLDVVFIGTSVHPASGLIQAMGSKTAEGRVFPLDLRLRPEGESGPLVISPKTYAEYFRKRAQLWEIQSLTKARVITGKESDEMTALIEQVWRTAGQRSDLRSGIFSMYQRVVKERGKGEGQFKSGKGGLMAIEFIVQYLQMRDGIREPNTLKALEQVDLKEDYRVHLRDTYRYLRQIESILRRMNNLSVSQLPMASLEQQKLARRMGFMNREDFVKENESRCSKVEEIGATSMLQGL